MEPRIAKTIAYTFVPSVRECRGIVRKYMLARPGLALTIKEMVDSVNLLPEAVRRMQEAQPEIGADVLREAFADRFSNAARQLAGSAQISSRSEGGVVKESVRGEPVSYKDHPILINTGRQWMLAPGITEDPFAAADEEPAAPPPSAAPPAPMDLNGLLMALAGQLLDPASKVPDRTTEEIQRQALRMIVNVTSFSAGVEKWADSEEGPFIESGLFADMLSTALARLLINLLRTAHTFQVAEKLEAALKRESGAKPMPYVIMSRPDMSVTPPDLRAADDISPLTRTEPRTTTHMLG